MPNVNVIENRKKTLQQELKRITEIIIRDYQPEKIILFGSLANGHIHEWSDIDLVIIKDTEEGFIDRLHRVHLMVHPQVGVNFVVYTPQEVKSMLREDNYFFRDEIVKKGKVVYEKEKQLV